jgi:hypothetical protein
MEYCKKIIAYASERLRHYMLTENDSSFDGYSFFQNIQCRIFLKNGGDILWAIDNNLSETVIPDLDEIDFAEFDGVPEIDPEGNTPKYEYDEEDGDFEDIEEIYESGITNDSPDFLCQFNSVDGACLRKSGKPTAAMKNYIKSNDIRPLYRGYTQCGNESSGSDVVHFIELSDMLIGALVGEQLVLSNEPDVRPRVSYGDYYGYESKVVEFYKNRCPDLKDKSEWNVLTFEEVCDNLNLTGEKRAFTIFVLTYLNGLVHRSHGENFTRTEILIESYFSEHEQYKPYLERYKKLCHYDFYKAPKLVISLEYTDIFMLAVHCLVSTSTFEQAMDMFLCYTDNDWGFSEGAALLGAMAGAYYQHYHIPVKLLKQNRYFDLFKDYILPFDNPSYSIDNSMLMYIEKIE